MSQSSGLYKPLLQGQRIRLLRLLPGQQDDVSCELFTVELSQAPPYEAISYTWGDPVDTVKIQCSGDVIPIRLNLHAALRRFRHLSDIRILWTDAICIYQRSTEERERQVGLMGQIYDRASRVLIWLGEDTEGDADEAFRLILYVHKHFEAAFDMNGNFQELAPLPSESLLLLQTRWQAVRKFFDRPWFSRVWVLQEVGLASTAVAFCGEKSISWSEIAELVTLRDFRPDLQSVSDLPTDGISDAFDFLWCTYEKTETWRNEHPWIRRKSEYPQNVDRSHFFNLMVVSRNFKATDPRDHIYAFLGHPASRSATGSGTIVEADYNTGVDELYCNVAMRILDEMQSLVLLGAVDHNDASLSSAGASWVPQLDNGLHSYILTPLPGCGSHYYDASRRFDSASQVIIEPYCRFVGGRMEEAKLKLRGFRVDTVYLHSMQMLKDDFFHKSGSEISEGTKMNPVESAWAMLGPSRESQYSDNRHAFLLTLIAGLDDRRSPAEEDKALHEANFLAYCKTYFTTDDKSLQLMRPPHSSLDPNFGHANCFASLAQRSCSNRKLFTTAYGRFGFGSRALKKGDLCYVLF